MRGTIKKFAKRDCKAMNGTQFSMLDIFVDVVNDKNEVRTYRASLSWDFARKYFKAYGKTTSECVGAPCEVSLVRSQYERDGVVKTATKIKYFNLLTDEGTPFRLVEKDSEIDF